MSTGTGTARDAAARILVVEDEMMIAMLLEDILADFGYEVVGPYARVAEAVDAARRQELDAAILDVNLDGERVYPVAEALDARSIPFLFATGYGEAALTGPWTGRLALRKPFHPNELGKLLSRLMSPSAG